MDLRVSYGPNTGSTYLAPMVDCVSGYFVIEGMILVLVFRDVLAIVWFLSYSYFDYAMLNALMVVDRQKKCCLLTKPILAPPEVIY